MQIQTAYGETMTINQSDIFFFPNGIPAFEEEKQFAIVPFGEDSPFYTMQSLQTPELSFVITEVFNFFKGYEVELSKDVQEFLKIKQTEDVVLFVILTVGKDVESTTANLRAPIVVNITEKIAKQIIGQDTNYSTKTPLLQSVKGE